MNYHNKYPCESLCISKFTYYFDILFCLFVYNILLSTDLQLLCIYILLRFPYLRRTPCELYNHEKLNRLTNFHLHMGPLEFPVDMINIYNNVCLKALSYKNILIRNAKETSGKYIESKCKQNVNLGDRSIY